MKYRAYNKTFDFYSGLVFSKTEVEEFVNEHNQCKGGHWIIHTEDQYMTWKQGHDIYKSPAENHGACLHG